MSFPTNPIEDIGSFIGTISDGEISLDLSELANAIVENVVYRISLTIDETIDTALLPLTTAVNYLTLDIPNQLNIALGPLTWVMSEIQSSITNIATLANGTYLYLLEFDSNITAIIVDLISGVSSIYTVVSSISTVVSSISTVVTEISAAILTIPTTIIGFFTCDNLAGDDSVICEIYRVSSHGAIYLTLFLLSSPAISYLAMNMGTLFALR